ncbi:MAG: DinB family protein [Chitinophagaceae bacterium]
MAVTWNKAQILSESEKAFRELTNYCHDLPADKLFFQPEDKWSIAQHIQHLIIATRTATAAYALPKFIVRWIAGKPNRPSRSMDDLVNKYKLKLATGAKASGRYIPAPVRSSIGKEKLMENWQKATATYLSAIHKNWKEEQFDQYIAPHPLLGKITLRELCYFTAYHTGHHLASIKAATER